MTRPGMVNELRRRLKEENGVEIDKDIVNMVLDIEEDIIYEIIATCDEYNYLWGKIQGTEKFPQKIYGKYSDLPTVRMNYGYSNWKIGVPNVKWSKIGREAVIKPAKEYFDQDWVKYTSQAREFRQQAGLEELPEFDGMSEEEIQAMCQKADQYWKDGLNKAQKNNVKKRSASISNYHETQIKATYILWEQEGYVPTGACRSQYKGKVNDGVDYYMSTEYKEDLSLVDKYEVVMNAIDIRDRRVNMAPHEELEKLKEKIELELKKAGVPIPKHVNTSHPEKGFVKKPLKYRGEHAWSYNDKQNNAIEVRETQAGKDKVKQDKDRLEKELKQFEQEKKLANLIYQEYLEKNPDKAEEFKKI